MLALHSAKSRPLPCVEHIIALRGLVLVNP
jgi:hypothetical protein